VDPVTISYGRRHAGRCAVSDLDVLVAVVSAVFVLVPPAFLCAYVVEAVRRRKERKCKSSKYVSRN
jgi:hypothetical protein